MIPPCEAGRGDREAVGGARERALQPTAAPSTPPGFPSPIKGGGFSLLSPSTSALPAYVEALERGWTPQASPPGIAERQLQRIRSDPADFLASLDDRDAKGPPVELPDGSTVPRLPSFQRWIWDDEFCGVIDFRWAKGAEALPPTCLGHIGYAVVPWKRRRGYASAALRLMLPLARAEGLAFVELTTDPDNLASQRVIVSAGGRFVERFEKPQSLGGGESLRFQIDLLRPPTNIEAPLP
ncbi:MAG: GNAT family N-acetyltransferase [Caulobacteraceae bacterium]